MKKKFFNKAVLRELVPYFIFILFLMALMNGGMFYVLIESVEKRADITGEALESIDQYLQYYEASQYRMVLAANILVMLAGGLLLIWQAVRYVAPVRHVIDYMNRGKKIHYGNLSNEIIG